MLPSKFYVLLKAVFAVHATLLGIRACFWELGASIVGMIQRRWQMSECVRSTGRRDTDAGKNKPSEKNVSQRHFVHHTSHMDQSGMETGPLRR